MLAQKWNWKKHDYEPYRIPIDWNCKLYSDDMNEEINCAHCGKKLKYGDSYSSLEIHNAVGLAYPVCEKCYNIEWQHRNNNKKIKER